MINITLNLTEQEALTVRNALNIMLQHEGLPAARRVIAVDDKIVAAAAESGVTEPAPA